MKIHVLDKKIMWGDLDPLGIVFYPNYYRWMDGCAHLFMEGLGLSMEELLSKRNLIFALVETGCRYYLPGRYHDTVRIRTSLAQLEAKTLLFTYRFHLMPQEELMAQGWEKRICLEVSKGSGMKASEIPRDIAQILEAALDKGTTWPNQDRITST